jgi:hypothetical protein
MLGTRVAAKPIELGNPITIARMSSIALNVDHALAEAWARARSSAATYGPSRF